MEITFHVGGNGGYDDVAEVMDVSEVNKLSTGAEILKASRGPEILGPNNSIPLLL